MKFFKVLLCCYLLLFSITNLANNLEPIPSDVEQVILLNDDTIEPVDLAIPITRAGGDLTVTGSLVVQQNSTLGNADTDVNTVRGTTTILKQSGSTPPLTVTVTGTSSTNALVVNGSTKSALVINAGPGKFAEAIYADGNFLAFADTTHDTNFQLVSSASGFQLNTLQTGTDLSLAANNITGLTIAGNGSINLPNLTASQVVVTDSSKNLTTVGYTSSDVAGTIVQRNASGTFASATPVASSDVATKGYVDSATLTVHAPAVVATTTNTTTSGLQTIHSVTLSAGDRVLLTGQSDTTQNGLWLVSAGSWSRPTDFATGTKAGNAYVLITEDDTYAGSSWVCTTPDATIGDQSTVGDPIVFVLFTEPDTTTGNNVGTGLGTIFRDKTGNFINFKTIAAGTHIVVTNNANDVTLSTDATSVNTASTIVARNGSGNFSAGTITANLSGAATTATTATNFTGSLAGDVTGTQGATVVAFVGGQSAATIAAGATAANAATNANTPNTIVERDASGNFNAGIISANIIGNLTGNVVGNLSGTATNSLTAVSFSNPLVGDVTGNQTSTVVSTVGGQSATNVAAATVLANAATSTDTASTIVRRDASGNFAAGIITANVIGNLTGNVVGNLTGNVVGNLTGTATNATNAVTATNFSGSLAGDVTGTQSATVVLSVSGVSAATIAAGATAANAATAADLANTIVKRDNSGNFATNMITIDGSTTLASDVATKAYVDAVATGLVPKPAVNAVATSNIGTGSNPPQGTQIVDGITVTGGTVLLANQTNPIYNGIWNVTGTTGSPWTYPSYFASGSSAQGAYVFVTGGAVYANSSWACTNTNPTAEIGTNALNFTIFSNPVAVTAANTGGQPGQIFFGESGSTLLFKTLGSTDTNLTVSNNTNTVTLATNATAANVSSSIVARDASGNFTASTITASLSGAASLNVLKSGDTMTGNLNMAAQSEVRLQDATGGQYVGLRAPTTVGTSYTLDLPSSAPTGGQFLQATSASATQWTDVGGTPTTAKTYYVSLAGSDSNDGSIGTPLRTVSQALVLANTVASSSNPVAINVGAGIFVENNSGGPLVITAAGISIIGSSDNATTIQPNTITNDLFNCTTQLVQFSNLTLDAGASGSTANGVIMTGSIGGSGRFDSVVILRFNVGLALSASTTLPTIIINDLQARGNLTAAVTINNARTIIKNSIFLGPFTGSSIANTGVTITGPNALVTMLSNSYRLMITCITTAGGANTRILGSNFESCTNGIVSSGGSATIMAGCNFVFNNSSSINAAASGSSTTITIDGTHFNCTDSSGSPQGTAIQATTGGAINIDGCTINGAVIAIQSGTLGGGDTSTTSILANSVIIENSTTDIKQVGTSTLHFVAGNFDVNKVSVANTTNVSFAGFDRFTDDTLTIGNAVDAEHIIYQVFNGETSLPSVTYEPNYYGYKGTVYVNQNADATFNGVQAQSNDVAEYVITGNNAKQATLALISDTANFGASDNVRGWTIAKTATNANLAMAYSNNDTSGQAARGNNTVMQLDGFNNQVNFPVATNTPLPTNTVAQLIWAGDTNLYRSATGSLTTDGNLTVGGTLTGNFSGSLTGNATTATTATNFTGSLSGDVVGTQSATVVSSVSGVSAANIAAGATAANAATASNVVNTIVKRDAAGNFAANIITAALNGNANTATNATNAVTATNFSGSLSGDVTGTQSATVVVSVSGVSAANIAAGATAANAATASDVANTIVKRDSSGNFATHMITIDGTTTLSTDVATKSYVDSVSTGLVPKPAVNAVATSNIGTGSNPPQGTQIVDGITVTGGTVLLANQTNPIYNGIWNVTGTTGASWTYPSYFASGSSAQGDYVFVTGGAVFANSSWVCTNTNPNAQIGTNALNFTIFSNPGTITAANIGGQPGQFFAGSSGSTLNFKTLGSTDSNLTVTNNTTTVTLATNATAANVANTIVARDASGSFTASTITANLIGNVTGSLFGNATSATTSTNFSGSLAGNVTGNQTSTVVATVGSVSAANIAAGATAANAATASNVTGTIVKRDASGNFAAGTITANLIGNVTGSLFGNATSATTSTNFSGSLAGDVTGTQSATVVALVAGQSAATIAAGATAANAATNADTPSTIVKRDALGNFVATTISANIIGNLTGNVVGNLSGTATNATNALNFTNPLVGDVTGNQTSTVVSTVGGQSAANVAAATLLANAATSANTVSTIVRRDASGNFAAGVITANLIGNVTGAASLDVLKAGDVMTGALTLPAGTTAAPTLNFSGSTTSGISAAVTNTLSLDTNGVERMSISTTDITAIARLVLTNIMCNQAIQAAPVVNGSTITVGSTTSVVLATYTGNIAVTIAMPASPINGQLLTIIAAPTNNGNLTITYTGATFAFSQTISPLNPATNPNSSSGGSSVTYIYNAATTTWYTYNRG